MRWDGGEWSGVNQGEMKLQQVEQSDVEWS
jgi:hypothetical protein